MPRTLTEDQHAEIQPALDAGLPTVPTGQNPVLASIEHPEQPCINCGRPLIHHLGDRCPLGIHISIDAFALDRVRRTGHPRLLRDVLNEETRDVLSDVEILEIK